MRIRFNAGLTEKALRSIVWFGWGRASEAGLCSSPSVYPNGSPHLITQFDGSLICSINVVNICSPNSVRHKIPHPGSFAFTQDQSRTMWQLVSLSWRVTSPTILTLIGKCTATSLAPQVDIVARRLASIGQYVGIVQNCDTNDALASRGARWCLELAW